MGQSYDYPNRIAGFYENVVESQRRVLEEFLESDRLLQEFTEAAVDFVLASNDDERGLDDDAGFEELPVFERLITILVSKGLAQGASSVGFAPSRDSVQVYLELPDRCDVVDTISRSGYQVLILWIQGKSTNVGMAVRLSDREVTLTIEHEATALGTRVVLRMLE